MAVVTAETEANSLAGLQLCNLSNRHVHGIDDDHNILTAGGDVQVDGGAHHFGNVDLCVHTGSPESRIPGALRQVSTLPELEFIAEDLGFITQELTEHILEATRKYNQYKKLH